MFAIAYDLDVVLLEENHPKSSRHAYADLARTLGKHGFKRVQGSVFAADHEDLSRLFQANDALRGFSWLGPSVKNVRAFRMEQGADFTSVIKKSIS